MLPQKKFTPPKIIRNLDALELHPFLRSISPILAGPAIAQSYAAIHSERRPYLM